MIITKLKIKKIVPNNGLIGFCSFIMDDCLFLGNIAIFTNMHRDGYRLVFPEKKIQEKSIQIFYPLNTALYFQLEEAVNKELQV